jgi:hypothetical protein
MKFIYTFLLGVLCAVSTLQAQVIDTVFLETFTEEPADPWAIIPIGDDQTWVNHDADGLTPYDFDDNHYTWFFSEDFHAEPDSITGEPNYVMASLSYMDGFAAGNRNWLIMPPITVSDNSFVLHWKSAPFQLPRYMDGYSVLVSTNGNDIYGTTFPFTDTLFRAAQMNAITGNGESLDLSNFEFSSGYIHADGLSNWDYIDLWAEGDSTLCRGFLEPHSVSLSDYAGQTVYIAFLHDADDDYFIELDDVLITRSIGSSTGQAPQLDLRLTTYPNPADRQLNVLFQMPERDRATLRITDMQGRSVREVLVNQELLEGEQSMQLQLQDLPAGMYQVQLTVKGAIQVRPFTKR